VVVARSRTRRVISWYIFYLRLYLELLDIRLLNGVQCKGLSCNKSPIVRPCSKICFNILCFQTCKIELNQNTLFKWIVLYALYPIFLHISGFPTIFIEVLSFDRQDRQDQGCFGGVTEVLERDLVYPAKNTWRLRIEALNITTKRFWQISSSPLAAEK
jgi:hypothetical protein